jgi:carbonic anhydrase
MSLQPLEALHKLKQGNEDYLHTNVNPVWLTQDVRDMTAVHGQKPYAAVLSCSDSRVPPEHVFSAGIGDLFVVRTAGNIVGDFELGSLEFAVKALGVKLILILGHTKCGAVISAFNGAEPGGYINSIIEEIKPHITEAKTSCEAEILNIKHSYNRVMRSEVISALAQSGEIIVTTAMYDIETGKAEFDD